MSIKFYRRFIRPSVHVPFPEDSPEFTQYVLDTYISTNKCTEHRTATYSPDNLIKTIKSVWANQESFDEALADPIWNTNADYTFNYISQNNIVLLKWVE